MPFRCEPQKRSIIGATRFPKKCYHYLGGLLIPHVLDPTDEKHFLLQSGGHCVDLFAADTHLTKD